MENCPYGSEHTILNKAVKFIYLFYPIKDRQRVKPASKQLKCSFQAQLYNCGNNSLG